MLSASGGNSPSNPHQSLPIDALGYGPKLPFLLSHFKWHMPLTFAQWPKALGHSSVRTRDGLLCVVIIHFL